MVKKITYFSLKYSELTQPNCYYQEHNASFLSLVDVKWLFSPWTFLNMNDRRSEQSILFAFKQKTITFLNGFGENQLSQIEESNWAHFDLGSWWDWDWWDIFRKKKVPWIS